MVIFAICDMFPATRGTQIAVNAGGEGAIVLGKVNDANDNNFGWNALTGEYEDLVKPGVHSYSNSFSTVPIGKNRRFATLGNSRNPYFL
jgi:hypothetical protein